jgi:hypothetical protein
MTINKIILFSIPAIALFFSACEKTTKLLDENNKAPYVDTTKNGWVKMVHAYAPLTPAVGINTGPKVRIFMDGTSIVRDSLAYNATFPNPSGAYAIVPTGSHTFYYVLSRAGTLPQVTGDTVFKTTINVAANQHYTAFLVDSAQSPGVLVTQDNYGISNLSSYQVRFANLVANPNERYDVYADSVQKMIATNIGYREVSNFISVPVPVSTENYSVRKAGTTTVVYTLAAFGPTTQRAYTLYTRGRNGATGRTPGLTFYTNR